MATARTIADEPMIEVAREMFLEHGLFAEGSPA